MIRNFENIKKATLAIPNTMDYIMTFDNKFIVQIIKVWGRSVLWLLTV
jgi:hypothetical protein